MSKNYKAQIKHSGKKLSSSFPSYSRSGSGLIANVGGKNLILGSMSMASMGAIGAMKQMKRMK